MINHQNLNSTQDPGHDGSNGIPVDKFGEVIGYENNTDNIGGTQGAAAQYSGNISWLMYNMSGVNYSGTYGSSSLVGYSFTYDNANRLKTGDFGYYASNAWRTTGAYDENNINYDNGGNLTSLYRYNDLANADDALGYYYVTGKNRLDHIADGNEELNYYYTYDDNGNVISDTYRTIAFIIYDSDNLPVWVYKTNGEVQFYTYDMNDNRVRKTIQAGTDRFYFNGIDGKSEAVCLLPYSSNLTYNIWGNGDNIGQVKVVNNLVTGRYYYLKDHLGSIKMTVTGEKSLLTDTFSGSLSQWSTVQGSGFSISSGALTNSSSGDNYLVNSSSTTMGDGYITVSVKNVTSSNADPSIIVRYQDNNNFYMISPYNNYIQIYEKLNGTFSGKALGYLPSSIVPGTWYTLRIDLNGGQITASWNGQQIVSWTDTSPWSRGKVGFRQCSSRSVQWDNFYAYSKAEIDGWDDYYPYGSIMPNRSSVQSSDNRYKFNSEERDTETGWDYFGKRLYDSFTGSFPQCDPLADLYPGVSPYVYCLDNPINIIDPKGSYTYTMNGMEINQDMADHMLDLNRWDYGDKKKQKENENQNKEQEKKNENNINIKDIKKNLIYGTPFDGLESATKWLLSGFESLTGWKIPGLAKDIITAGAIPGGLSKTGSVETINLISKTRTIENGLDIAERFLGNGYRQIAPDVFRSADGLRQFRMTDSDILGLHGKIGPHFNFEIYSPSNLRIPIKNYHMPIF